MAGPADPRDADKAGLSSVLSGNAGNVVQARDVSGGVHFHSPSAVPAAVPHLLRADVAGFVGRQRELEALATIPGQGGGLRLAIVTGTAGAGKTSLVLRFAHQVRPRYPGGDLFVDLRGYDSGPPLAPGIALERFLRALGVAPDTIARDLEERAGQYRSLLAGRQLLVVLDNAATVGQVRPLLPGDDRSLVIVTSRSRLSGLSARDGARRVSVGLLDQGAAVDLIEAATGGYRAGDCREQVAELAELCARLPLALRIAAERAAARPLMPLAELIAGLRSRSGLWDALSADDEQEADAVRTVFAWSYRALPHSAARVFRLLGLHPGPDVGAAAAAAMTGLRLPEMRSMLEVLTGAHLLEQTGPARYQFHDLLRAFAADSAGADESQEGRDAAFSRLVGWYLHSAHAASQLVDNSVSGIVPESLQGGIVPDRFASHRQAVEWYAAERANLRALIDVLDRTGQGRLLWQLAVTIRPLIYAHGAHDDRLPVARAALRGAQAINDPAALGWPLSDVAAAERLDQKLPEAARHYREATAAFRSAGDNAAALSAANGLGLVRLAQRDLLTASRIFADAAEKAREIGAGRLAALIEGNQALALLERGEPAAALAAAQEALAGMTRAAYQGPSVGEAYDVIIRACIELGYWEQAEHHLRTASQLTEGDTDLAVRVILLIDWADLNLAIGNTEVASDLLWQAENLGRPLRNSHVESLVLSSMGVTLLKRSRPRDAAGMHRRAVAMRRELPDPFRLAQALAHLGDALAASGSSQEAAAARTEATGLLARFSDGRAVALQDRIARQA